MFISRVRFWAGLIAATAITAPAAAEKPVAKTIVAQTETADAAATEASPIDDAIAFSQSVFDQATAALTNPGASEAQKLDDFQGVLAEGLALDVIGKFMLGTNRKSMSEAQIARYDTVFPDYITRLYADQFKDIVGRPLQVNEAKPLGARDVFVRTQFARSEGGPIMVDWRVRKLKDGSQKMIDIIVSGVSIMLVKREEFSSFIAANGIDALLDRLEQEAAG